jgi:hypothetical protein
MSAAGRSAESASDADAVAAALRDAEFAQVVAHADGDGLAAAGVLARALMDAGAAYQVSVARTTAEMERRLGGDHPVVALGADADGADASVDSAAVPASVTAFEAARELGASPDPVLALAGVVAWGSTPGAVGSDVALEAAGERGVAPRPGVAVPTEDLADGLAHSTLAHAEYSGDSDGAQALLAELDLPMELDEDANRRVASVYAIDATAGGHRSADAVERALRPHDTPDGPFETVEGYADVLDAVARSEPGVGVALALGHGDRTAALDAWRERARTAHHAVRAADPERYSGLVVARTDAPTWTVARLLRDFRSPEPVALVVGDSEATVAGPPGSDQRRVLRAATDAAVGGTGDRAYVEGVDDADALAEAAREAV